MLLLQSAMAGGILFLIILLVMLLAGLPALTRMYVKIYRRIFRIDPNDLRRVKFFRVTIPFLVAGIFALLTVAGLFRLVVLLFDVFNPGYGNNN
jgi:hypothetical protein